MCPKLEMYVTYRLVGSLWQFARPRTLILIWMHGLIGYAFLSQSLPSLWSVILVVGAATFCYIAAVSMNDISDQDVDEINLPKQRQINDRPLVNKTLNPYQAKGVSVVASIGCVVCCYFLEPWFSIVGVSMVLLSAMYSFEPFRISRRGALAQLLLPIVYVVFPMCIGALMAGMINGQFLLIMLGSYSLFTGRLFLKDIRDEVGDRLTGKATYLVRHGEKVNLLQAGMWMFIGVVVILFGINSLAFVAVGMIANAGILWSLRGCFRANLLEAKLVWVAIVGRFASMMLATVLVSRVVINTELDYPKELGFIIITAAIFLAGVWMLYDELQSVNRQHSVRLRQQVVS